MSLYTNDTDTLRQMLSMSVPQMFSSIVTIVAVICAMLYTSVYLTILVAVVVFFIMKVFKFIASHSGKYFIKQQETLGDVNGYIEEMINGQKVVKVFCHEEKAKEVFREKNAALCENATKANQYANILMPIMMNLGNLQYILIAIVGGKRYRRSDTGRHRFFLAAVQELFHSHQPGFSADQLCCYGTGRCETYF